MELENSVNTEIFSYYNLRITQLQNSLQLLAVHLF